MGLKTFETANKKVCLVVLLSLAVLFHYARPSAGETEQAGRVLYEKHCSSCHGPEGRGSDKGPPLVHRIYRPKHHADITFHLAVRNGVRAHHWRFGNMPPIRDVDKNETEAIIRYIRGLQREAGIF